ncbi:MAG: hypothetical protein IPI46_13935 [Bacteroidetes bacterium]|nr:hypothetical protein [Bacteroidota bacterium]
MSTSVIFFYTEYLVTVLMVGCADWSDGHRLIISEVVEEIREGKIKFGN